MNIANIKQAQKLMDEIAALELIERLYGRYGSPLFNIEIRHGADSALIERLSGDMLLSNDRTSPLLESTAAKVFLEKRLIEIGRAILDKQAELAIL